MQGQGLIILTFGCVCLSVLSLPPRSHAESPLGCVNNETFSEVNEQRKFDSRPPEQRSPEARFADYGWATGPKIVGKVISFTARDDGKSGLRLMDMPERTVRRTITRYVDCLNE